MFNSNMHITHSNAHIYISGPPTGVTENGVSESGGGKTSALDD
jgi:hypothetical protein